MKLRLFFTFAIFITSDAIACGCGVAHFPNDIEKDFRKADKVFRANVLEVVVISSLTDIRGVGQIGRELYRAEVAVTETFKGDTIELVYVVTDTSDAACGIPIRAGDDYVFFVDTKDKAHACSSSRSAQIAQQFEWDWNAYISEVEGLK
jgi:hypothetical protein